MIATFEPKHDTSTMRQPRLLNHQEDAVRWPLIVSLAFFFGAIFFVNEQNFSILRGTATLDPIEFRDNAYAPDVDDAGEAIETGSPLRRIAYPLIGLAGFAMLFACRRQVAYHVPLIILAIMYLAWLTASVAWSASPGLAIKRIIVLSTCVAGVTGAAKCLSLKELAWTASLVSAGLIGFSLAWEFKVGVFAPWLGIYRFAGAVHPNTQASYCVTMTLALFAIMMIHGRLTLATTLGLLIGVSLLLLTKSRSSLAGAFLAMFVTWMLSVSQEKRTFGLLAAPLSVILLGFGLAMSTLGSGDIQEAASLGRETDGGGGIGGLNGRVPLWGWCFEYIGKSPVLGYGYDSFWTPDRIQAATEELEWTVPNAHNAIIDVALSGGLVGSLLFGTLALITIFITCGRLWRTKRTELCFPAAFGIFAIINSCFESGYSQPTGMDSFFLYAALTMAVLMPTCSSGSENAGDRDRDAQEHQGTWKEERSTRMRARSRAHSRSPGSETRSQQPPITGWGRPSSRAQRD